MREYPLVTGRQELLELTIEPSRNATKLDAPRLLTLIAGNYVTH